MISKVSTPKAATMRLAMAGPMPRIWPEARYFSMPSTPVGGRGLQHLSLELKAMGAVADPKAAGGDPFACGDRRRMADDRHEVTFATGMDLQDSEAALGIVEGDALDRAREGLQGRSLISLCGSEHLVHGACREEFPASSSLSLDGTADEVSLLSLPASRPKLPAPASWAGIRKFEAGGGRPCHTLTNPYVLCLFFLRHRTREASQTMIRTGSTQKLTEPSETEQQAKDMKRLLAKAEQQIRKLQEKVADQKQQIRELQAQAKHEDGLAAEREELKAEIADLKGEIKELTRANREQVEKLEALRAESARLKAGAKVQNSNGMQTGASLRGLPALS